MAEIALKSIKFPGLANTYTIPQIDTTLTQSGQVADSKVVGDEIEEVKSDLRELVSVKTAISFSDTGNKYIRLADGIGSTVSLTPVTAGSSVWRYAVVACASGQKVDVDLVGGSSPKAWGFIDSNNILLSVAEYGAFEGTITAPEGTAKLILNDNSGGTAFFVSADGRVDVLESDVASLYEGQDAIESVLTKISADSVCNRFFKELHLIGADPNVTYKWYVAARNHATSKYNVGIAIDGTSTIVAYARDMSVEPDNPVYLPQYNNSGISAYAILDWSALEDGSNKTYNIPLNTKVITALENMPVLYSYLDTSNNIEIAVPDEVNAFVGDTLQLYYKGMFRCVNPYNYAVKLTCDIGAQYPRYYEVTPTQAQVGEHQFTIEIVDNNGKLLANKAVTLKVSDTPDNPASQINILCVGASCSQNGEWVGEFQRKLTSDLNISNANFVGRMAVNNTHLEATGGYTWNSYTSATTSGLYKFYFNSEHLPTTVNVGDTYTNNGKTFTVTEINIPTPDGGGYISCTSNGNPTVSGTLTIVTGTGDATLTYYNSSYSGNPFSYDGDIDLEQYAEDYCGGKIDVVYTELFVNGSLAYQNDVSTMLGKMKDFVNMFRAAFPNCKFALGMPYCPDEKGGTGANYHAIGNFSWGYGIKFTFQNYMLQINKYLADNNMDDYVTIVNWTNEFDSENDFLQTTKTVNVRSQQTEVFGQNGIHPAPVGYYQMADSAVRHFVANYCQ